MNRARFAIAAFVAGAFAAVALGQNADKNSAGPTRNDYRLRVVEPAEGGVITGSTVRVVVNTEIPAEVDDTHRDVNSMPRPDVDVFLDNELKGTMREAENVIEIESVGPGPHSLILLAKNRANEIIDRKVVEFSTSASLAASTNRATSTDGAWTRTDRSEPSPADTMAAAPMPPATAPIAAERSTPFSAASAPTTTAPTLVAQAAPVRVPEPRREPEPRTLPETASSDPSLALAGAGLLLAGLLVRRFAG